MNFKSEGKELLLLEILNELCTKIGLLSNKKKILLLFYPWATSRLSAFLVTFQ